MFYHQYQVLLSLQPDSYVFRFTPGYLMINNKYQSLDPKNIFLPNIKPQQIWTANKPYLLSKGATAKKVKCNLLMLATFTTNIIDCHTSPALCTN